MKIIHYLCPEIIQCATFLYLHIMIANVSLGYRKLLSFFLTLLGFGSTFVFESCYGPIPKYDLEVSNSDIHFPAEGGSASIEIQADSNWQITRVPDYVLVSPLSGNGTTEVTIEMQANTSDAERCDTLYVLTPDPADYVVLTQDAAE